MKLSQAQRRWLWLVPLVLLFGIGACATNDEGPTTPEDTTAPADIPTLASGAVTPTTVVLTWTAVGDDGTTGTAQQYDIRYSTAPITAGNFGSATQVTGEPAPAAAGAAQQMTVTSLAPNTPYYFALKVADEKPNWSGISNVATATTAIPGDTTPPAGVSDLDATVVDPNTVQLTWTAVGDDGLTGMAAAYDIRYALIQITSATWDVATQASTEPAPEAAGTQQTLTISGLLADRDYYFAMTTRDEVPNESGLSNIETVHTPVSGASPPGILLPDFPNTVCIDSPDPWAVQAKAFAQVLLNTVNAYSRLAGSFFASLQGADWEQAGDCWTFNENLGGCAAHYRVCRTGSEYIYEMTLNGSCGGETYNNWVQYRVVADNSARTGAFYLHNTNSTTVVTAWTWSWAANENSGSYTFYDGDPATAPIEAMIDWSRSANRNTYDVTYTAPGQTKLISHVEQNPCRGWLRTYPWDPAEPGPHWWQEQENDISWESDGTGYWDIYDENGTLQEHHTW